MGGNWRNDWGDGRGGGGGGGGGELEGEEGRESRRGRGRSVERREQSICQSLKVSCTVH